MARLVSSLVFAALFAFAIAAPASAQIRLDVTAEGGLGYRLVDPIAPVGVVVRTDVSGAQPTMADIAAVMPRVWRIGADLVIGTDDGPKLRLGAAVDGWSVSHDEAYQSLGLTQCAQTHGTPECEIIICHLFQPCPTFASSTESAYREVMPELAYGTTRPSGTVLWIGLQPFIGHLSEQLSATTVTNPATWSDGLNATFAGGMAEVQIDQPIFKDGHLLVGAAAGAYLFTSASDFGFSLTGSGVRAQLMTGVSFDLRPGVSLGFVSRADYWSAWPGVTTPRPGPIPCHVKSNGDPVCVPPQAPGQYGLAAHPALNLGMALQLTVRLGH